MTSDFTTLKERVNLADYISVRTGQKLSNAGSTINLAECPFCTGHDCFRITPEKQSFHCFQCSPESGGDIYDFIERYDHCDKAESLKILAKEQGYELIQSVSDKKSISPEEEKALNDRTTIFEAAAVYYEDVLSKNSRAIGYQRKVRRHTEATLKAFRVGYTDGRLYEHLKDKGYSDEQLIESGLVKLKNDKLYDFFGYDLFIYPHLDKENQVAGFTIKDQRKKYKYRLRGEHWVPNCIFHNMQAFTGKEVFLVEGENDLLAVHGRGELPYVASINGQISKAQLAHLVDWAPGKTIYLCFDNDKSGKAYVDRVCRALKKFCLPDVLAKLFKEQITELRIVRFDPETKDIDEYLKSQKDPAATLKALIKGAERYLPPLLHVKELYSTWARDPESERKFNYDTFGKICFEWFVARGKYFIVGEDCHLYFDGQDYRIGTNTPFKALLYKQSGINAASNGAKIIIQSIESQAYLKGDHTSVFGWIHTSLEESTVYFNLCDTFNTLLKISPGKIEKVSNGTNAEKILLKKSPKTHPIRFSRDANIKKGMERLQTHLFDNLTCNLTDRYFIVCLLFNVVLIQYAKARGINRFSGSSGCGKTSAAGLLSTLIFGENLVTTGTAASDFSEAAVSPLVISDNLESDAVQGARKDFLLTVATGIVRQKRKAGSDSENIYEQSCTQIVCTAIEPFIEPELIQRTNEIIFDHKYFNQTYIEATALESNIKRDRDLIWSTIFQIISNDILPGIDQKKVDALKSINRDYPNHSKKRLNELYAVLYLILNEVVKYISQPGHESDGTEARWIFKEWIVAQNERSFATEADSNKLLQGLEALLQEYGLLQKDRFEQTYAIKVETGELEEIIFTASTKDLYWAFNMLAKERGIKNPFNNVSQLGARISDSLVTLKKCKWEFKRYVKTIKGDRKHCFVKHFER